ncbi:hypothetical protein WJ96_06680 [Burkholderia ubonensis]|uniref:Lipoprotein n=1 Tax=Burkholderia ubonensis TaxID=101571 RepID=A0AAW3MZH7_9BURK|nr:hypothetical protein [Burkholderia ubonensis]KVP75405.1 hypothetical protein WJ93_08480 [Burkholderia ubonensis]KVP96869.1 hypothetical protein WJ97_13595 [Burkholderia ubonensis]KVP98217.1 hypothetical protein WJ96_06680 [Burkholderia ubonensis]KVZ92914.1 hypothetical protein WL25_18340 [Burkholderia ubonensis]
MNKLVLYAVMCGSLGLVACGDNGPVTERHIAMATERCAVNGGLAAVVQADRSKMFESCGYRCSRATGQYKYEATFSCKNGAKFDLSWEE